MMPQAGGNGSDRGGGGEFVVLALATLYAWILNSVGNAAGPRGPDPNCTTDGATFFKVIYWLAFPALVLVVVMAIRAVRKRQAFRATLISIAAVVLVLGMAAGWDIVHAYAIESDCGV